MFAKNLPQIIMPDHAGWLGEIRSHRWTLVLVAPGEQHFPATTRTHVLLPSFSLNYLIELPVLRNERHAIINRERPAQGR